jgi:hypothetical protein
MALGCSHERVCPERSGEAPRPTGGDIENTHEALRKMVLDLESLDATIVQFNPDFQVETIKPKAFRPPKDWSNRGQMSRIILSVLRQASEPLTTRDIALQLLVERALDKSDLRLLRLMTSGSESRSGARRKTALSGAIRGRGSTCFGK